VFQLKGLEYYAGVIYGPARLLGEEVSAPKPEWYTVLLSVKDPDHERLVEQAAKLQEERLEIETHDRKTSLRWRGEMPDATCSILLAELGVVRSVRDGILRLKEKSDLVVEPLTKGELFEHNLFHVALSRIRGTALLVLSDEPLN
jgi:hypothetical protein